MTPPASQVGLADNVLSSELRIYKEAREGDAKFKGTVTLKKEKYLFMVFRRFRHEMREK
jgi:hypothetical protein